MRINQFNLCECICNRAALLSEGISTILAQTIWWMDSLIRCWSAIITCYNHTLVVLELLSEEAGHNELWIHEEKDLLLQEAGVENASTQPPGGKVHLKTFKKQKRTLLRTQTVGACECVRVRVCARVCARALVLPAAYHSLQSRCCRMKTHTVYWSSPYSWQGIPPISNLNPLQLFFVFVFFSLVVVRSTVLQCWIFTISRFGHQCRRGNASQMSPAHPVWFLQRDIWLHPNTAGRVVRRRSRLQRFLETLHLLLMLW